MSNLDDSLGKSSILPSLMGNKAALDQEILNMTHEGGIENLGLQELSVLLAMKTQEIRLRIGGLFDIAPEKITDELLAKDGPIRTLISQTKSRMDAEVSRAKQRQEPTAPLSSHKKIKGQTPRMIITTLADLDKPNLLEIARELKLDTPQISEDILLRATRLLKRQLSFLINHPNGLPKGKGTIGSVDDLNFREDAKRFNSMVKPPKFRS